MVMETSQENEDKAAKVHIRAWAKELGEYLTQNLPG
jgi:hypothetical protein